MPKQSLDRRPAREDLTDREAVKLLAGTIGGLSQMADVETLRRAVEWLAETLEFWELIRVQQQAMRAMDAAQDAGQDAGQAINEFIRAMGFGRKGIESRFIERVPARTPGDRRLGHHFGRATTYLTNHSRSRPRALHSLL